MLFFNIDKNYNQFKLIELDDSMNTTTTTTTTTSTIEIQRIDNYDSIPISKCGYLKNFKLMKIIPLLKDDNDNDNGNVNQLVID